MLAHYRGCTPPSISYLTMFLTIILTPDVPLISFIRHGQSTAPGCKNRNHHFSLLKFDSFVRASARKVGHESEIYANELFKWLKNFMLEDLELVTDHAHSTEIASQ